MKIKIFIIVFSVFISCTSKKQPQNVSNFKDFVEGDSLSTMIYDTFPPGFLTDSIISLEVNSFRKIYDPKSSTYEEKLDEIKLTDFEKWMLTKNQIDKVISTGRRISGVGWDLDYIVLPIWYIGEVKINNVNYKFKINAASYFVLLLNGDAAYFGVDKNLQQYFLVPSRDYEEAIQ